MQLDKMKLVLELRKEQGWNPTFVQGELAAISWLLDKEDKSPEEVARATFQEDWPGFVSKFV